MSPPIHGSLLLHADDGEVPSTYHELISAGEYHTCGLRSDGSAWCWGGNEYGQLGDGFTTDQSTSIPTPVSGGGTWLQISSGYSHTCGLKSDGTAWCWGRDYDGQLGDGFTTDQSIPTPVSGGGTWLQISTGRSQTCGLKSDGTAWCWGWNEEGQLGDGSTTDKWIPTPVSGGATWAAPPDTLNPSPGASLPVSPFPVLLAPTPDDQNSSDSIGAIVGGVVGGVAFIALAAGSFVLWRRKSVRGASKHETNQKQNISSKPPTRPEQSMALSTLSSMDASDDPVLHWIASRPSQPQVNSRRNRSNVLMSAELKGMEFLWTDVHVLKPLGLGSFGKVFLGNLHHAPVALKVLIDAKAMVTASSSQRAIGANFGGTFENIGMASRDNVVKEASLMVTLRHPNVAMLVGFCLDPVCLAIDYYTRGSVYDILQQAASDPSKAAELTWQRRVSMAADAAAGMWHLHTRSPPILHRDLKSPNLLVDAGWTVKVADMGLSKLLEEASKTTSATTEGGTANPRWLAPEVLGGSSPSAASDVFAFGVVMWELLCWKLPWADANVWTIVGKVQQGERLPVPPASALPGLGRTTPSSLDNYVTLMRRCWAQDPQERPQFGDIAAELRSMAL